MGVLSFVNMTFTKMISAVSLLLCLLASNVQGTFVVVCNYIDSDFF